MTRFQDLLAIDPRLTPGEEQCRASNGLADAVAQSHFKKWQVGQGGPGAINCMLLAVAPYSRYDLMLLDLLDERLGADPPAVAVYVANIQDYASVEQLRADFPGIGDAPQTPIVAHCGTGSQKTVACGHKARGIAADVLGLSADELSQRIVAEVLSPNPTVVP